MDRLKVACQIAGVLNIICIIASLPGLYFLMQLPNGGPARLLIFDIILLMLPIALMTKACITTCMASMCDRSFSWNKKAIFHYWIGYNSIFGVGLTIYSLYALLNLEEVSSVEKTDKETYYLCMKVALPLAVLYCIKMVVVTMYYVKRVHYEPTDSSSQPYAKQVNTVQIDIQPLYNSSN